MAKGSGPVHLARVVRKYKDREYVSWLLRRSFREDGKVRHETVANVTALPDHAIDALRRALTGAPEAPGVRGDAQVTRSLPHGHVAAVWAVVRNLGLPFLLGPPGRERDLALALVVARVCRPAVDPATRWWTDTTLALDLDVADATPADLEAAVDGLATRQPAIETALGRRHLVPGGRAFYAIGQSTAGAPAPASTGPSYGLLRESGGVPVAIDVVAGGEVDPTAFVAPAAAQRQRFRLEDVVLVGEHRLLSSGLIPLIEAAGGLGWITALRPSAVQALAVSGALPADAAGPIDPVEFSHPDHAGERLVVWKDPALASAAAADRDQLLEAAEQLLAPLVDAVGDGRLAGVGKIRARVERALDRLGTAELFDLTITGASLVFSRRAAAVAAEAALDGVTVLRTRLAGDLEAVAVVDAYRGLADPALQALGAAGPRAGGGTRQRRQGRAVLGLLAAHTAWHLRRAWVPLLAADHRSTVGQDGPAGPGGLLDHLATLTRNTLALGDGVAVDRLCVPTAAQQQAFDLLGSPVPVRLGKAQ